MHTRVDSHRALTCVAAGALGEPILFTTDYVILSRVALVDRAVLAEEESHISD